MAVAAGWPLLAGAQPRVRVIATGGTIANHSAGRLSGPALVDSAPAVASIARVEAETFSNVSSIDLTLADWVRLSKRVNEVMATGDVAGVVVTGGSDTLEELAWWLDLTVGGDRAVVVTGAMRRPSDAQADGPRNLADAVRVAVDPAARQRGALVVMGGLVLRARDAVKLSLTALDAFGSTADGPIGRVSGGRVEWLRRRSRRRAGLCSTSSARRNCRALTSCSHISKHRATWWTPPRAPAHEAW